MGYAGRENHLTWVGVMRDEVPLDGQYGAESGCGGAGEIGSKFYDE